MGYSVKKTPDLVVKAKNGTITLDSDKLQNAALVIRAINHPLRKKIIELINGRDKITVTQIYVELRTEQSVASQHLAILREAKWLNTRRDGKFIYYSINEERFNQINEVLEQIL